MTTSQSIPDGSFSVTATTVVSLDYEYISESYEDIEVQYITGFVPSTSPGVEEGEVQEATVISTLTVGILLGLMIILIAFGNSLVVLSVLLERRLRTFENFFFASLAVADLSIAVFVLPFCLTVELSGHWQFSYTACDLFIFTDVACCTASILHLCAIGLNRYWSITSPLKYATKQTCKRATFMIASVWVLSFVIACPPLFFGWPKRQRNENEVATQCTYDVDIAYVIYSSCGSFYIPLLVMTVVYVQIFRLSLKGARFRRLSSYQSNGKQPGSAPASPKDRHMEERSLQRQDNQASCKRSPQRKEYNDDDESRGRKRSKFVALICPIKSMKDGTDRPKRRQAEAKTAKTLGIIMGAFVICWLPFFLLYVIRPLCNTCRIPVIVDRFALWLGYFNSLLNPLIYICCKPLFRVTFKRILTLYYCRKSLESRHRRHEMHYFRGRHKHAVASWDGPGGQDSFMRRHREHHHPESFGNAFSEGYREKRQAGLRQMPLGQYADEFGEKCARCKHDVDPLDSSGANQDIEDYLNYVITNGYLRPDLCKDLGIGDMFSPHKCDSKFHCGHCCKANEQFTSGDIKQDKVKVSDAHCSMPGGDLVCSTLSSQNHKCDKKETVQTSKSESSLHKAKADVEQESQSSPSTACTLMQTTCTLPSPEVKDCSSCSDVTKSPASFGLTRDSCSCSLMKNSKGGSDIVRIASLERCKETGL